MEEKELHESRRARRGWRRR